MALMIVLVIVLYFIALSGKSYSCFTKSKVVFLKAIMALVIVGHHLSAIPMLSFLSSWGQRVVAVFLFISGYGLAKSYAKQGEGYLKSFFCKRIWNVFLPCLVASIGFHLCFHQFGQSISDLVACLVVEGRPPLPFSWYVYCILVLYNLFYFAFKWIPVKFRIAFLFAGVMGYVGVAYLMGYEKYWFITAFAFPIGVLFATYENIVFRRLVSKSHYAWVMAVVIGGTMLLLPIQNTYTDLLYFMILPLVFVLLLMRIDVECLNDKILIFLSSISYEIYLMQGFPITFFKKVINIEQDWAYIILVYITVVLLAVLLQKSVALLKHIPSFIKK